MENRSFLHYFVIILKGMAMGIAELVPGVSGGTIAFVSGIYEEFISSINNVDISLFRTLQKKGVKAFWEQLNGNFLLALFLGMGISIFSFAKIISSLLENHPIPLWSFFFGLVLASVLIVAKDIKKWSSLTIVLLIIGILVAYYITTLPVTADTESLPFLLFSGAIAICAMILPGISGSFILVLLGSYKTILDAVHERDIKIVATVGLGAAIGILSFAKLLKWMFNHYRNLTLAILTGFIIGSLNKIWPWKEVLETKVFNGKVKVIADQNISPWAFEGDNQLIYAIILAIIGFSFIFILEKVASKK